MLWKRTARGGRAAHDAHAGRAAAAPEIEILPGGDADPAGGDRPMIDVTPRASRPPEAARPHAAASAPPPKAIRWTPRDARARARLSAIRAYEDAEELDVHDRDLLHFRFRI